MESISTTWTNLFINYVNKSQLKEINDLFKDYEDRILAKEVDFTELKNLLKTCTPEILDRDWATIEQKFNNIVASIENSLTDIKNSITIQRSDLNDKFKELNDLNIIEKREELLQIPLKSIANEKPISIDNFKETSDDFETYRNPFFTNSVKVNLFEGAYGCKELLEIDPGEDDVWNKKLSEFSKAIKIKIYNNIEVFEFSLNYIQNLYNCTANYDNIERVKRNYTGKLFFTNLLDYKTDGNKKIECKLIVHNADNDPISDFKDGINPNLYFKYYIEDDYLYLYCDKIDIFRLMYLYRTDPETSLGALSNMSVRDYHPTGYENYKLDIIQRSKLELGLPKFQAKNMGITPTPTYSRTFFKFLTIPEFKEAYPDEDISNIDKPGIWNTHPDDIVIGYSVDEGIEYDYEFNVYTDFHETELKVESINPDIIEVFEIYKHDSEKFRNIKTVFIKGLEEGIGGLKITVKSPHMLENIKYYYFNIKRAPKLGLRFTKTHNDTINLADLIAEEHVFGTTIEPEYVYEPEKTLNEVVDIENKYTEINHFTDTIELDNEEINPYFNKTMELGDDLNLYLVTTIDDFIIENFNEDIVSVEKITSNSDANTKVLQFTSLQEGICNIKLKQNIETEENSEKILLDLSFNIIKRQPIHTNYEIPEIKIGDKVNLLIHFPSTENNDIEYDCEIENNANDIVSTEKEIFQHENSNGTFETYCKLIIIGKEAGKSKIKVTTSEMGKIYDSLLNIDVKVRAKNLIPAEYVQDLKVNDIFEININEEGLEDVEIDGINEDENIIKVEKIIEYEDIETDDEGSDIENESETEENENSNGDDENIENSNNETENGENIDENDTTNEDNDQINDEIEENDETTNEDPRKSIKKVVKSIKIRISSTTWNHTELLTLRIKKDGKYIGSPIEYSFSFNLNIEYYKEFNINDYWVTTLNTAASDFTIVGTTSSIVRVEKLHTTSNKNKQIRFTGLSDEDEARILVTVKLKDSDPATDIIYLYLNMKILYPEPMELNPSKMEKLNYFNDENQFRWAYGRKFLSDNTTNAYPAIATSYGASGFRIQFNTSLFITIITDADDYNVMGSNGLNQTNFSDIFTVTKSTFPNSKLRYLNTKSLQRYSTRIMIINALNGGQIVNSIRICLFAEAPLSQLAPPNYDKNLNLKEVRTLAMTTNAADFSVTNMSYSLDENSANYDSSIMKVEKLHNTTNKNKQIRVTGLKNGIGRFFVSAKTNTDSLTNEVIVDFIVGFNNTETPHVREYPIVVGDISMEKIFRDIVNHYPEDIPEITINEFYDQEDAFSIKTNNYISKIMDKPILYKLEYNILVNDYFEFDINGNIDDVIIDNEYDNAEITKTFIYDDGSSETLPIIEQRSVESIFSDKKIKKLTIRVKIINGIYYLGSEEPTTPTPEPYNKYNTSRFFIALRGLSYSRIKEELDDNDNVNDDETLENNDEVVETEENENNGEIETVERVIIINNYKIYMEIPIRRLEYPLVEINDGLLHLHRSCWNNWCTTKVASCIAMEWDSAKTYDFYRLPAELYLGEPYEIILSKESSNFSEVALFNTANNGTKTPIKIEYIKLDSDGAQKIRITPLAEGHTICSFMFWPKEDVNDWRYIKKTWNIEIFVKKLPTNIYFTNPYSSNITNSSSDTILDINTGIGEIIEGSNNINYSREVSYYSEENRIKLQDLTFNYPFTDNIEKSEVGFSVFPMERFNGPTVLNEGEFSIFLKAQLIKDSITRYNDTRIELVGNITKLPSYNDDYIQYIKENIESEKNNPLLELPYPYIPLKNYLIEDLDNMMIMDIKSINDNKKLIADLREYNISDRVRRGMIEYPTDDKDIDVVYNPNPINLLEFDSYPGPCAYTNDIGKLLIKVKNAQNYYTVNKGETVVLEIEKIATDVTVTSNPIYSRNDLFTVAVNSPANSLNVTITITGVTNYPYVWWGFIRAYQTSNKNVSTRLFYTVYINTNKTNKIHFAPFEIMDPAKDANEPGFKSISSYLDSNYNNITLYEDKEIYYKKYFKEPLPKNVEKYKFKSSLFKTFFGVDVQAYLSLTQTSFNNIKDDVEIEKMQIIDLDKNEVENKFKKEFNITSSKVGLTHIEGFDYTIKNNLIPQVIKKRFMYSNEEYDITKIHTFVNNMFEYIENQSEKMDKKPFVYIELNSYYHIDNLIPLNRKFNFDIHPYTDQSAYNWNSENYIYGSIDDSKLLYPTGLNTNSNIYLFIGEIHQDIFLNWIESHTNGDNINNGINASINIYTNAEKVTTYVEGSYITATYDATNQRVLIKGKGAVNNTPQYGISYVHVVAELNGFKCEKIIYVEAKEWDLNRFKTFGTTEYENSSFARNVNNVSNTSHTYGQSAISMDIIGVFGESYIQYTRDNARNYNKINNMINYLEDIEKFYNFKNNILDVYSRNWFSNEVGLKMSKILDHSSLYNLIIGILKETKITQTTIDVILYPTNISKIIDFKQKINRELSVIPIEMGDMMFETKPNIIYEDKENN